MHNNIPNFFIVGAGKSGTTSLYHYLSQHPDIYMSPIKEPNYFCPDITNVQLNDPLVPKRNFDIKKYISGPMTKIYHRAFITNWDDYLSLFKNSKNEKIIGEASINYLPSEVAAKNIFGAFPEAKILIILRNPIDRALSHYFAALKSGQVINTFSQEIKYNIDIPNQACTSTIFNDSFYYNQIKRYYAHFPGEKIKIILYEDYKNDIKSTLNNIFEFLLIDSDRLLDTTVQYNTRSIPRFKKINYFFSKYKLKRMLKVILPNKIVEKLKEISFRYDDYDLPRDAKDILNNYYLNDIIKLSQLINRDLTHWIIY